MSKILHVCALLALIGLGGGSASAEDVTDELTLSSLGITSSGTTYGSFTSSAFTSNAVYVGNAASNNGKCIQLRSKNNNSGIVATTSGGKLKSIIITFNSSTTSGRVVDVYGKSEAYTAASDLYSSSTQGTKIGSATYSTSAVTITPTADYEYIGIRSNDGALYIDKIEVVWGDASKTSTTLTFDSSEGRTYTVGATENLTFTNAATLSPTIEGATITYESSNTAVATVDASGTVTVTPTAAGSTTITATYNGDDTYDGTSASYTITVSKAATTLTFADTEDKTFGLDATEGTTFTNAATLSPAVEGATITYESSNTAVATVDESSGAVTVTTSAEGTATITATYAGNDSYAGSTASYTITVADQDVKTWTYSFSSKNDLNDSTTVYTFNEKSWTFTPTWKNSSYFGSVSSKGIQIGSGNSPATSIVFSSSDFAGVIKSVTVNASTANNATATIAVTVGGVSYGEALSLTTSAADYEFMGESGGEIAITLSQPSTSKALYVKSITVKYNETETAKTATKVVFANGNQTFTQNTTAGSTGEFTNVATVTLADGTAIDGATVTYTSSDDDKALVDEKGYVVVDITELGTYTITATYASNDTYAGSSASYTITVEEDLGLTGAGTADDPYTVADALTIINKEKYSELGQGVYVKGIISKVVSTAPHATYGSLNYYVSDDGNDTITLYVYGGLNADSAKFTSADEIAVGDIVLIQGNLALYGTSTPEFGSNNTLEKFYERSMTFDASGDIEVSAGHNVTGTLSRTFNANAWNALVLPFALTAEQVTATFGTGAKVAGYTGTTANEDGTYTLNFTTTTTIEANVPVFIYGATDVSATDITGLTVVSGTPASTPDGAAFAFTGFYQSSTLTAGDWFISSDNNLYRSIGTETIGATRAVFHPTSEESAVKGLSVSFNGGNATGISAVTGAAEAAKTAPMYNLSGQRVDDSYRGVVIQNGKKYVK